MEAKIPERIKPIFVVDVRDVITCFKFGDDRLRESGLKVKFWPLTSTVVQTINTLTLPYERVIISRTKVACIFRLFAQ